MMTISLALSVSACFLRRASSFHLSKSTTKAGFRLFGGATSLAETAGVSRLGTFQTLCGKHGVPGSVGCNKPDGDVVPIATQDTPELLSSMSGKPEELLDIHPYLLPLAQSQSTGNLICACRPPLSMDNADDTSSTRKTSPWPIVETRVGAPGMRMLALNSEHLMRRIVCEMDAQHVGDDLIQEYNHDLGRGLLGAMDTPYEKGSVEKLGYGVDKYVLLRVGPFPDLYQQMSKEHLGRGDEQSALIAAESANGKLSGFGSNFRLYARLLGSLPNREEEARDAARMCLRLPLATIGMEYEDFHEVAWLGQLVDKESSTDEALVKIKEMLEVIKKVEQEDPQKAEKSQAQLVAEKSDELIANALLSKQKWSEVRPKLADLFASMGQNDMASFVDWDR